MQLIFLESVFTKYHKIKLVRQGVVRQIVKSTFAENLRYPSPDHPRNQANKQFMEETRIGTAHILNIWIVDTIFRVDAKKKRSPVNAVSVALSYLCWCYQLEHSPRVEDQFTTSPFHEHTESPVTRMIILHPYVRARGKQETEFSATIATLTPRFWIVRSDG